jgi:hypothetical protein
MNDLSIGIVTFKERKELIKELVKRIRLTVPETVDIILAVNGNNEEEMPNDYRTEMLDLAKQYKNVYPIFCPEFKGLSKLWNNLVIFSKTEYNFILCDDVVWANQNIYNDIINHIEKTKQEFFTINGGFSHFICTKGILHKIGYFDERLCGFGEEDGDMHWRHIKTMGYDIPKLTIFGIYNNAAYNLKNEKIETHQDNKPRFNRELILQMYEENKTEGYATSMCPFPIKKIIPDLQQYPYEKFIKNNKHNIKKFERVVFDE